MLRHRNGGDTDRSITKHPIQNYAKKLQARLKWAYQKAQDNNKRESECHKRYYDQKKRCMSFETK